MRAVIATLDPRAPWITENRPVTPAKLEAMRNDPDQMDLRARWIGFADAAAGALARAGWQARAHIMNRWDLTPAAIDALGADLVFVPHATRAEFGPSRTPVLFYMQVMQRWLFSVDPLGWGPAASSYPCDPSAGDPERGTFERYQARLVHGNVSKFRQPRSIPRAELLARGDIPAADYVFFPCQVPHDQSLTLFSDIAEVDLVGALAAWSQRTGVPVVFKEHPANRRSMVTLRAAAQGAPVMWSEAGVHDLIREARAVYTLNSGVGFEALFHEKPLVTFARAEYDCVSIKAVATDLDSAWRACRAWSASEAAPARCRFVDWYCRLHAVDMEASEVDLTERLEQLVRRVGQHVHS